MFCPRKKVGVGATWGVGGGHTSDAYKFQLPQNILLYSLFPKIPFTYALAVTFTTFTNLLPSLSLSLSIKSLPLPPPRLPISFLMDHHFAGKLMTATPFGSRADIDHMPDTPYRGAHHRRAQSETFFRFPDDILLDADADVDIDFNLDIISDNNNSGGGGGGGVPMAVDSSKSEDSNGGYSAAAKPKSLGPISHFRSLSVDADFFEGLGFSPSGAGGAGEASDGGGGKPAQEKKVPHHRHSNSMDGSTSSFEVESFMGSDGVKKAMGPDRLAELALIDPKRAKRYLFALQLTLAGPFSELDLLSFHQSIKSKINWRGDYENFGYGFRKILWWGGEELHVQLSFTSHIGDWPDWKVRLGNEIGSCWRISQLIMWMLRIYRT